ncbi:ATP-binding protein [Sediminibacterium sp.]|uniref:ATP-binding protein n=1 Tax=Sediminibacterium sp. TaxID=1917865 RepID=UPI00272FD6BE|nr:ATP-binding protein [Sediminibacterium sp.]MDP1973691.1 ATP-binding protein [Sediminibacterium sp.]MDP2422032.1 ATP-binding protein [Sediminibacterium sp.]
MEIKQNNPTLNAIISIYEQAKDSKFSKSFLESIQNDSITLQQYFKLDADESLILALFIAIQLEEDNVDLQKLAAHIDCSKLKILSFKTIIDNFFQLGILAKEQVNIRMRLMGSQSISYMVNRVLMDAILDHKPMPIITKATPKDIFELLELVYKLGLERDDRKVDTFRILTCLMEYLEANAHFPLVSKMNEFDLEIQNKFIFLHVTWKSVTGSSSVDVFRMMEGISDNNACRYSELQKFLDGENELVAHNLLEVNPAVMTTDTTCQLTDNAFQILHDCGLNLKKINKHRKDIIKPEDIKVKELIFSDVELSQIQTLEKLIEETSFQQMQTRLSDKGLPTGISILFHGAPGTGKTEIAKQLARKTNRELMHVNISECKTMWFGESEKIVKKIFTDYKAYAKDTKTHPILFFNEADAIISKRKELRGSNVEQTENAIQNILLEELENFQGILIATTNLVNNIDPAFDRRFLFKIKFQPPCTSNRANIWKLKLPHLTNKQANQLAQSFVFSGGQIDNIFRKKEIVELLYGESVDFETILRFCKEETLQQTVNSIGFRTIKQNVTQCEM